MNPVDPAVEVVLPPDSDACEALAAERLTADVYDYFAGGADQEATLRANRDVFARWWLCPRVLRDVGTIDLHVSLLGDDVAFPVLLAPAAFQRLAHPDGEVASTRAAHALGTIPLVSTLATTAIEELAAAAPGPLWFQLYVLRDRALTRDLVQRAEAAGCRALCVTVDVPVQGNRLRDARNHFQLPADVEIANLAAPGRDVRGPAGAGRIPPGDTRISRQPRRGMPGCAGAPRRRNVGIIRTPARDAGTAPSRRCSPAHRPLERAEEAIHARDSHHYRQSHRQNVRGADRLRDVPRLWRLHPRCRAEEDQGER